MDDTTPPTLHYMPTRVERPTAWSRHWAVLIAAGALWAVLVVVSALVIPSFENMFRDLRTELPGATKVALRMARWCARDYGWLMTLPMVGLAFLLSYRLDRGSRDDAHARRRANILGAILGALMFAVLAATLIAMMAPGIAIVQPVTGASYRK